MTNTSLPQPKGGHRRLTAQEFDEIFSSDDKLAGYLASLTPAQVIDLAATVQKADLPEDVRKTLLKLLENVRGEAEKNETLVLRELGPTLSFAADGMRIQKAIDDLEAIAAQL
jgi:hypothetical protein